MLHGFLGRRVDWLEVSGRLADRYRCLLVDLPGHGESALPKPGAFTFEHVIASLEHTLDTLGVRRCAVVGYSMGGRIALRFALQRPGRVGALVLESASPGIGDAGERAARADQDERTARRIEQMPFEVFLREWYAQPLFGSLAGRRDLLERTVASRLRGDPAGAAAALRALGTGRQPDLWPRLADLVPPTLFVSGGLDATYSAIGTRMAAASDRVRSESIDGAGHNVHLEQPEAFARLLGEFLDRQGFEP
jgi:2-succinyl-6-hydroxy-2,4-cyclohexadiene-1-carboxylate synthase